MEKIKVMVTNPIMRHIVEEEEIGIEVDKEEGLPMVYCDLVLQETMMGPNPFGPNIVMYKNDKNLAWCLGETEIQPRARHNTGCYSGPAPASTCDRAR